MPILKILICLAGRVRGQEGSHRDFFLLSKGVTGMEVVTTGRGLFNACLGIVKEKRADAPDQADGSRTSRPQEQLLYFIPRK